MIIMWRCAKEVCFFIRVPILCRIPVLCSSRCKGTGLIFFGVTNIAFFLMPYILITIPYLQTLRVPIIQVVLQWVLYGMIVAQEATNRDVLFIGCYTRDILREVHLLEVAAQAVILCRVDGSIIVGLQ